MQGCRYTLQLDWEVRGTRQKIIQHCLNTCKLRTTWFDLRASLSVIILQTRTKRWLIP